MDSKEALYFQEFFKISPDLMMISRVDDAVYVAINDGFTNLLGYTEEEVLNKSALDLGIWVIPLDRNRIAEEVNKKGIIQNIETQFRTKNGSIIPVLLSASKITINQVAYFIGTARDITELKQKENIIKESEDRFHQLSELAPVGIYLTDANGQCEYVNSCWREVSGLSIEQAQGSGWINGIHPEDRVLISDNWTKMVNNEGKWGLEYRFQNQFGKTTWVYGVASPRKDSAGKIVAYVGVNVDITVRKKAQELLKESQLLLKSSLEAQKDTILFSIDQNYQYLYFNKAHQQVMKFAYNKDIELGMNILFCISNEEDRKVAKDNYDKALNGESHTNIRVFGDMNLAYYESFFNPIYNEIGEIIGATGLARDITNRIKAESSLLTNEKKFHDLFSSMMEGFAYHQILLDDNNKPIDYLFLEMNDVFEKLTGLDREKTKGKKLTEVIPGITTDATDWIGIYGKVALTGEPISFESFSTSLNKWYSVSAYSPQPGFFATLFQDITDKKLTENELKNFNTQLEKKVHQRTNDLENSMEALRSFSYTVSHDLRAPLRAIDGFSSMLVSQYQDILGNEGNRLVKVIRDNTKRMNELITGLLELARVTNDELKKCPLDMNYITNRAYQEIVKDEDLSRICFTINPLFICQGESILIKQVWINLISNAVKFTKKKEKAVITIRSYQTKDQMVYVIQDNGDGFNPAYKNKLFVPFHRLHSDNEFAGSGIGLSIVERIITRHGGKVWAEGEEGVGATFYFSLPINKEG